MTYFNKIKPVFFKVDFAVNNLYSIRLKATLLLINSAEDKRGRKTTILVHNLETRILVSIGIAMQRITNRSGISYAPKRDRNLPIGDNLALWNCEQKF